MLNPWILLGLLGAFVLTNGYSFYKGHDWATSKCESAKFESQVRTLQVQLDNQRRATVTAEKERDALKLRESELETVVEDFEKQLDKKPETVMACTDPQAARALRAIK